MHIYFKMIRKDLREEIEVPEEINVSIEENKIKMKKDNDELERRLDLRIKTSVEGNKIILEVKQAGKNQKKMFGTIKAHINNMIKGLTEKFQYKLQVANVHFPMNTEYDKENNEG